MTRKFVLRPRAESDIQAAYEWYESQRIGLGELYLSSLQKRLAFIRDHPEANPIVYRDVRRAVVTRFPYLIFYVTAPTRISVLAVLHHARDPAAWPKRRAGAR